MRYVMFAGASGESLFAAGEDAGMRAGTAILCERSLEKSSSRPPPNSIFRFNVEDMKERRVSEAEAGTDSDRSGGTRKGEI